MLTIHCRCGACGTPMHEPFSELAENLNAAAAHYTETVVGDEPTRIAIICGDCKQNPEVARARMDDTEPGMPIGAMPLTLRNLKFLKETLTRMRRNENIRAGSCQNLARCYKQSGLQEEYQGRADAARAKVAACDAILPVITAALDAAEGGLAFLGKRINEALSAVTSFPNLQDDEEGGQAFNSPEEARAALAAGGPQTLNANAVPSWMNPAPNLNGVTVNCAGSVSPEGHLWHRVPGFQTTGGYTAYVYGPNCRAYCWDTDKGVMREFTYPSVEAQALAKWHEWREKMEEVNAYQKQEAANVAPPEPAADLCECGHVRREHEENDLAEPCDVHGCPCDGYSEVTA